MAGPRRAERPRRIDTRINAILIDSRGREYRVIVGDLSESGFRLETDEPLDIGEKVWLRVDRGVAIAAEIRWALGREAGGLFLEPPRVD